MTVLNKMYVDALLDGSEYVSSVRDTLDARLEAHKVDLDRQYAVAIQFERALTTDGNEAEKTAIRAFLNALRGGVQE